MTSPPTGTTATLRRVKELDPARGFRHGADVKRSLAALGVLALVVAAAPGEAMTVDAAPLTVLTREADAVVRGVVTATAPEVRTSGRREVWTRVTVAIDDVASGPRELAVIDTLELLLPGGETEDLGTWVPGVPSLLPGDTLVLLLERHGDVWQPLGYSLGALFVDEAERLWRAGVRGRPTTLVPTASWETLSEETLSRP